MKRTRQIVGDMLRGKDRYDYWIIIIDADYITLLYAEYRKSVTMKRKV